MPACASLLERRPKVTGLKVLKSKFNAENFTRSLSWAFQAISVQFPFK